MSRRNYWTTLRQRKISRRTMLGASAKAGVGAAGLALVGCGDDDDDAAPAAVDTSAIDAAAGDASAAASAAGEASAAASEASAAASEAAAAASQAADAADAAAALAAEAAESEDAANAAAAAEAAAAAAAQAADAASAAGDAAAAAVADAAAQAAEAAAQAARDAAAAVEAGTATAEAAQAAINAAAEAAAAAAAAAGEASAAAGAAAATAQETAEAAAETAAAAVAAAEEAADAAREAADAATMADEEAPATAAEFSVPWPLDQVDLDASIVASISSRQEGTDQHRAGSQGNAYSHGAVFNAAMEIDPADGSAIPSLAAPEWIDNVSLRATVEPAPFHDGSILTAHDMVFSYDRMGGRAEYHQGGETTDHPGGWTPTNPTRGAESWVRNEAVDDRTWSFELAGPDGGFFPVNLARVGEVAIVSQADVEGRGDAAVDSSPMGTGPYRFVSQTADENAVFERFEDHFLPVDYPVVAPHYAHNKQLTVVVRPELQSRLAGLEAGEIDTLESLGPDVVAPFVDDPDFTVQFTKTGQLNIYINLWQQTMDDGSPNPFLDLRVRQAANHAINRQALIDNLLLGVGQQSMFAFSGIGGYPTAEQKQEVLFDYDPERARALMAEAGYADGFDVPMYIAESAESVFGSYGPDIALAVEQELNAVGIRAELRQIPVSEYFTDAYTRGRENAPPGLFFFGANTVLDVGSMWECCTGPDGFFTLSPPLDPSLEELYQALKVEPDAERRTAMATELLLEHARQAYFIFLVEPPAGTLTAADVNWPLGGPFGRILGGGQHLRRAAARLRRGTSPPNPLSIAEQWRGGTWTRALGAPVPSPSGRGRG